jgi:VCBS repeat protein
MGGNSWWRAVLIAEALLCLAGPPALLSAQSVSFVTRKDFAVGAAPSAVAGGDFNGDGQLDLVVVDWGPPGVSVLLSNGDGTFQAAQSFTAGTNPSSVAVGDFNGDGKLDLAAAKRYVPV